MSNVIQFPVVAGIEIATDAEGRFNLNALHNASGLGAEKAPSKWMRNKLSQDLINAVQSQTGQICLVSLEGRNGGTFAHELLAVEYAGWISPAFRIQVNQTFIDYKTGKLAHNTTPQSFAEALRLAADQQEQLEKLEHKVAEDAPKVEFHDKVTCGADTISVGEAAKVLGTGQKRLFSFLRRTGWLTRRNEPYQAKINSGHLDLKISQWEHPERGLQKSLTPLVTGKGLALLQKLYRAEAV